MAIPEKVINEIRQRADIVEIVERYLPLKRTGRNYRALCPFHPEKTPSFYVSPEKQIYHCFGCGSGGNVFNFLMKYENIEFPEAVRRLANYFGIEIPEESRGKSSREELIFKLNKAVMEYYHNLLLHAAQAKLCRNYLEKRGIGEEMISLFKLGYAPKEWDRLTSYLMEKGWKGDYLVAMGISLPAKDGNSFYDLFRNRLIFPIQDIAGNVLGFGGRVLDDSLPKYINSPETAVYKKGKSFYGINISIDAIKKEKVAIIVEGYMDMIALYQHGISNVVASLGTSFTLEQAKFIKRYCDSVLLVYDADQAGELAALRGLDIMFETGLKAKAISLPAGYDPDSFVRKYGKEEFKKLLANALELFPYKLNCLKKLFGIADIESRIKIVEEMLETISKVKNYLLKSEYIKTLAQDLGFDEKVLWSQLSVYEKKAVPVDVNIALHELKYHPAERTLILIMLEFPEYIPRILDNIVSEDIPSQEIRNLFAKILELYPDYEALKPANLLNHLDAKEQKILTEIITIQQELDSHAVEQLLNDCFLQIKQYNFKRQRQYLTEQIKKAQEEHNEEKTKKLLAQLNELVKKQNFSF